MQLTRIIQLPDTLSTTEKAEFLQDVIVYLHDQLEEAESVPVQRAFGFIGTTGAIAAAWSICGLGMVAPVVAIPGVIIIAGMSLLSGVTLAKDVIESPEIVDLLHRLVHVLESKEIDQWVKLWEEVGTESFLKRLHYSCMGSFTGKGVFRHKSGSHPFDVAALFGGNKQVKPWEKVQEKPALFPQPKPPVIGQNTQQEGESVALHSHADRIAASPAPTKTPSSTKWINNFVSQTALIWGNQGSGKSWMARYVAKLKKDKGYRVVVLDPDSNQAEWEGVESYHDFEEIAAFLSWYVEELKGRYKAFNASNMAEDAWRAKLWADGKAIALICEEVTTYVDLIEDKELLTQFFRLGLTKSRKQEMPLTFVSHNNNQTALGGIKGLANLIDKMLQLELQTDIDPETLQPVASGKGAVKLDGSNQWVPVILPKLERKITNFGEAQPTLIQQPVATPQQAVNAQPDNDASATPSPATELKLSDSLGEPLKSIWLFAKKKGEWVTAKDVYNNGMSVLKGKGVKQIKQYFGLLADSEFGEIDEMDGDKPKSDSSVGFRAN